MEAVPLMFLFRESQTKENLVFLDQRPATNLTNTIMKYPMNFIFLGEPPCSLECQCLVPELQHVPELHTG